jgi:aerobic-type carbon monoxide dehydrogenase small subunit (CoxS/CutS family)
MSDSIRFRLNGRSVSLQTDGTRKLLWVLRNDLELTGTKYGCGQGLCGSCTVLVDGRAMRACQADLASVQGREVVTIEGLARGDRLHPLQEAFQEHGGLQCGYCTPGMILGAVALLQANPRPTREQIVQGMEGHLCRCGAHQRIIAAIEAVSAQRGGRDD